MAKNPDWSRDELILVLDFYFKIDASRISMNDPILIALGDFLNGLPLHRGSLADENFRSPENVYTKLSTFLRLDPDHPGEGLKAGSKLDVEVWNEFAANKELLAKTAAAIKRNYRAIGSPAETETFDLGLEDETFLEGQILTRLHQRYDRNPFASKKKKQHVLETTGNLMCEVCDFDFYRVYGDLGKDFAECHHVIPLSDLKSEMAVRLSDLAIVCANCHRILHRSRTRPMLSIHELREIVTQRKLGRH